MLSDADFMRRCFALAEQGRYTVHPNPVVGCVIVRDGQVLAEGWHERAGQAHAEVNALRAAGPAARGASAYVSLEPCNHQGRTGPCSQALVDAGIVEVIYGMVDPNPAVAGQGLAALRAAGIRVRGPVLADEAEALNPGFMRRMRHGMPYVRCKVGMSLDGRTAMASGESRWITGAEARADVHRLRARSSALVTGIGTVLHDDPQLDIRLPEYRANPPLKVVVDSRGRTPSTARLYAGDARVLLARAEAEAGRVDLAALLRTLAASHDCNEILVEAGPTLCGAFLAAGLVDELVTYIAPALLGDMARPLAVLPGLERLEQRLELDFLDVLMLGKDCRIRSLPRRRSSRPA